MTFPKAGQAAGKEAHLELSGEPKPLSAAAFQTKARAHTAAALEKLVEWTQSEDHRVSLAAISALLDRAYVKAAPRTRAADKPRRRKVIVEVERIAVGPRSAEDALSGSVQTPG